MRVVVFVAILGASAPWVEAGQTRRAAAPPQAGNESADRVAQAYDQFLRAHLIEDEDVEGAITSYKRAMALDPTSASIPADLADLYMRENRSAEAMQAAEQALKIAPTNRDAHRVLGTLHATLAGGSADQARPSRAIQRENMTKAVEHLEQAFEPPMSAADANLRAMLARLYIATEAYDKAIPVLTDLVKQEPGWQDGASLLAEAYASAGRAAEGITWLEEAAPDNPQLYATLGDFYGRSRRWSDAAMAYEQALKGSPRSLDYRKGLAEALMNTGTRADAVRARDVLREAVAMRGTDERSLYLLAEAERTTGDSLAAESAARRLVAQNPRNAQGFSALAEALEDQRRYQPLVDALAPAIGTFRGGSNSPLALRLLLPHLGFAYQELGQYDKAIASFEEARKISPNDASFVGYLIQAQMAAKNYPAAAELAHAAREKSPDDLRLARLESLALRRSGKVDQGLAILEALVRQPESESDVYVALAQGYTDANRGAQAIKLLQEAQAKFPAETGLTFELGAALDKQKRYSESEAVFRQLIAKEPKNAPALNYLGYMLAERGERLAESVDYIKRALEIEPENGSYLDSIGWAYFKDGKLDLALENLRRAAEQLKDNSVIQDHYGEVLFKAGRYDDAIGAWNRALTGDGDSIDRGGIDRKIRSARQKLPRR
jgi:tetratricopeptide (TPR) repeat protein